MQPPALDFQRLLDAVEDAPPVGAVQVMAEELGRSLGAGEVTFLAVDLRGRQLARLTSDGVVGVVGDSSERGTESDRSTEVALPASGVLQRVLGSQQVVVQPEEGGWRTFVPVSERGEAVGILEMALSEEPDEDALAYLRSIGHLLAFVVIANRRHTDLFEWGQRGAPLTLSAEIQRRLLPSSFTVEAAPLTLAGWLEPAVSVAGDTFDYSLDRDVLHLSVTDAMGHGVQSSLLATLMLGSTRNSRRRGRGLGETANEGNAAIAENARVDGSFVTGLLLRVDLNTAAVEAVNAGHVLPLLLRDGEMSTVELPVNVPFGVSKATRFETGSFTLEPGDRLVVVTDGMVERGAGRLDFGNALRQASSMHPREAVRNLADAVVEAVGGSLQDDATVLMLDWHGLDRKRHSRAGTDGAPA